MADAAVVVTDGIITYAGAASGLQELPPDIRTIDAGGGTILPGLVEAHIHLTYFNVTELQDLDIKYPVEYVTLQSACEREDRPRVRLHSGPQRWLPPQHRRVDEEGESRRT